MALPPLYPGGLKDTVACAFPATALGLVGELGTLKVVTAADADEATELPAALVALTVKVYSVPLPNPVTTIGELAPVA